jgi:hypothetical protein
MSMRSKKRALENNDLHPNDKEEKDAEESFAASEQSPRPHDEAAGSTPIDGEITYPEGGFKAWSVVFGAFCGTAASIGLYNTSGVFEAYMSRELLPDQSPSNVGWIFGIYAFVTWFLGVQVGPTFDAMGPKMLMIGGSVCTLGGIFALSACTGVLSLCKTCPRCHEQPCWQRRRLDRPPSLGEPRSSLTLKQSTIKSS